MSRALVLRKMLVVLDREYARNSRAARSAPLPPPAVCAGAHVLRSYLVVCHADLDCPCEFSLPFGGVCYCAHPRRLVIAARTRDVERARRRSQSA